MNTLFRASFLLVITTVAISQLGALSTAVAAVGPKVVPCPERAAVFERATEDKTSGMPHAVRRVSLKAFLRLQAENGDEHIPYYGWTKRIDERFRYWKDERFSRRILGFKIVARSGAVLTTYAFDAQEKLLFSERSDRPGEQRWYCETE